MKRLAIFAMFVAMAAACAPAPPAAPAGPTPAELTAAASALDQQFLDAFNKGDAAGLAATYWNSPEVVSIGPDGMGLEGIDAIKAGTAEMFKAMPGAKLELVEARNQVRGDMVMGWGKFKMTIPTPAGPQVIEGRFSDVKAMRDGKMVYIMDHASVPLPPPPDPTKK